jgi:hypothetical protein
MTTEAHHLQWPPDGLDDGWMLARKTGCCSGGAERGGGRLAHVIKRGSPLHGWSRALCGTRPGRLSAGWGEPLGRERICSRCACKAKAAP